jgi:hypothetical protein
MKSNLIPGISVVIMAHDRQEETIRAVNAIQRVNFGCKTEVIVSDNPSKPENIITGLPEAVIHKIRNPPGESLWHANQILQELDHEWTLLTHDDDEILPHLGSLFREFSGNPKVTMITGKSRILVNNVETEDAGYLGRLNESGLLSNEPKFRTDLFFQLFDIGPLFPASAMIVRTERMKKTTIINIDYDLAGDLAHSMAVSREALVVFDGSENVMNYHIHGGNSVFSVKAAGGLMSDFTIVRMAEAVKYDLEITKKRLRMLNKAVFISRILSKAFHLDERYSNVRKYANSFNSHFPRKRICAISLIPIPLGPLKIVVRRLMWKRLGVDRWGYRTK